jgi:hypothetical protein
MTDVLDIGRSTLANDLTLSPQAKIILRHLEKGKSITPLEALVVYGISRLSDCVFKIRNAGHDVAMEMCTDERGHGYGKYSLHTKLSLS